MFCYTVPPALICYHRNESVLQQRFSRWSRHLPFPHRSHELPSHVLFLTQQFCLSTAEGPGSCFCSASEKIQCTDLILQQPDLITQLLHEYMPLQAKPPCHPDESTPISLRQGELTPFTGGKFELKPLTLGVVAPVGLGIVPCHASPSLLSTHTLSQQSF